MVSEGWQSPVPITVTVARYCGFTRAISCQR